MAEPEPVPVRDLEVADRIAKAVRGGKAADRTPTIEQLVAAFGEGEPTLEARRRAARALALAGVAAVPDVLEVAPGQRLTLEVRHVRKRGALVAGILALVLLFAAVAPRRRSWTSATTTPPPACQPTPPPPGPRRPPTR